MIFTDDLHKNRTVGIETFGTSSPLPPPRKNYLTGTFCFNISSSSSWSRPTTEMMCGSRVEKKIKNTTLFHQFLSWHIFSVYHQFFDMHLLAGLGLQRIAVAGRTHT